MSSSLSQFGTIIDKKPQPGPPLKILLQERDQNDKIVITEEKKSPEKDLNCYLPLLKAALKGDWENCRLFFNEDPDAVTAKITRASETVLHIAVGTGTSIHFVENLLALIPKKALVTLTDQVGETALHYAAIFGNVEAARLLVAKNPRLTNTWNGASLLPLHVAAGYAHKEMVLYLLTVTRDDLKPLPFADESGVKLLNLAIVADFYDVAVSLVQRYPMLATLESSAGNSALNIIAGKPSAFLSGIRLNFWQRIIYSCVPTKFENLSSCSKGVDMENPAVTSPVRARTCCEFRFFRGFNFSGS